MNLYAFTLVCFLFSMRCNHCNCKRMVCEDIKSEETEISPGAIRCPPVVQGLKGEQGMPGLPGLHGNMDYEELEEIVATKIAKETQELETRIDEMNARIRNLTQKTPVRCDGVVYGERCFWADVHQVRDATFYDAFEICKKKNYELANIYSKGQYNTVMRYLESLIEQRNFIQVWTAMRKGFKRSFAFAVMSNGARSHYVSPRLTDGQWWERSPRRSHIYIKLQADDPGMGSVWPSYLLHGPLCQYNI